MLGRTRLGQRADRFQTVDQRCGTILRECRQLGPGLVASQAQGQAQDGGRRRPAFREFSQRCRQLGGNAVEASAGKLGFHPGDDPLGVGGRRGVIQAAMRTRRSLRRRPQPDNAVPGVRLIHRGRSVVRQVFGELSRARTAVAV